MAAMQLYQNISLREWVDLILAVGSDMVVLGRGEMGIGKSSALRLIQAALPTHRACYVDMTTKDIGDLLMPKVHMINDMDVVSFVPNAEIGLQYGQPLIIMWDEVGKAQKGVLNQCIRCWQEKMLGEHPLPEGSIQFATSNLAEEGLQDFLMPHHQNRILQATIRKPTAVEWTENWALDAGIHPTVIQAVNEFPNMLASWQDFKTPGDNQYIYDPRAPKPAFVTPRSLERASIVLHKAGHLPVDVKTHALAGLLGLKAAADIMAIDQIYGQLPRWEEVVARPDKAQIPSSAGAACLFVYQAIQNLDAKTCPAVTTYIKRFRPEAQVLFATTALRTSKAGVVTGEPGFFEWAKENKWLWGEEEDV